MGREHNEERDEKRELRRQRRIRNQVIAYLVLVVLLGGIGFGGYKGVCILVDKLNTNKQIVVEQSQEPVEALSDNEAGIIATPEEPIQIEEPVAEPTEEELALQELQAQIDGLTLEQKVANLFIVSPESITGVQKATRAGDGTRAALEQYAVGGMIYASSNVNGADQFHEMLATTKEMYEELYGTELWVVVCEDGSRATIAGSATGVQKVDTAAALGESGDTGNTYTAYIDISRVLNNYGVDINLSPVCDVALAEDCFIGEASFSNDADITASMIRQAVNAQRESGIMSGLMAFPGRGSVAADPGAALVATERTLEEMRTQEFLPFQAGIEEGAEVVVVSHITAENATGEAVPCSMSPVMIQQVLREELGFTGVVITDAMNQGAITNNYESGEVSVLALQAGADMILLPENFEESYQAVLDAVAQGVITEERINESLLRIYAYKTQE